METPITSLSFRERVQNAGSLAREQSMRAQQKVKDHMKEGFFAIMIVYAVVLCCLLSPVILGGFGMFLAIPAAMGLFFGGIFFNTLVVAAISPCLVPVAFFGSFGLFIRLLLGAVSVGIWYNDFNRLIVNGGSICNLPSYDPQLRQSGAYYFFDDAAVKPPGSIGVDPKAETFEVHHYLYASVNKHPAQWFPGTFGLRPIYSRSDIYFGSEAEPCAWGFGNVSETWLGCDPRRPGGLCGVRLDTPYELLPECTGLLPWMYVPGKQNAVDKNCKLGYDDLMRNFSAAADHFNVKIDGTAPLIRLTNPQEELAQDWLLVEDFLKTAFLYVPLGALILLFLALCPLADARSLHQSGNAAYIAI